VTPARWHTLVPAVLLALAVTVGAVANAGAALLAPTAIVGAAGLCTLGGGLAGRRLGGIAAGLGLVAVASIAGTARMDESARLVPLAVAGAALFCAAELAGRAIDGRAIVEAPSITLGVAAGGAALAIGSASLRGLLTGGGPAALAGGSLAAVLLAALVALAVRSQTRAP